MKKCKHQFGYDMVQNVQRCSNAPGKRGRGRPRKVKVLTMKEALGGEYSRSVG